MKKIFFVLAGCLCMVAASNARAQAYHVPDTGDPNERVCNPKSYTDLGTGIVRDNLTGLEWVKERLMANQWNYAMTYVAEMNAGTRQNYGYTDWRMPSVEELLSIWNGNLLPNIDPVFQGNDPLYWSSNVSPFDTNYVMFVDFGGDIPGDGYVGTYGKSAMPRIPLFLLRPVRGGQFGPADNFVTNGDSTVTDQNTGLMWQQCNYGQIWDGLECTGSASTCVWDQAVAYIEELNDSVYLGYDDWRLPTQNELHSLFDFSLWRPVTRFPDTTVEGWYWSSTATAFLFDRWDVDLYYGGFWETEDSLPDSVRAVRGGACRANGDWCIDDGDCAEGYECVEGECVPVEDSDTDFDGFTDGVDNCPLKCNPQQKDADGDGIGDVCDTAPGCGGCGQPVCEVQGQCDSDSDGIADSADNCPAKCNTQQKDADGDGIGDVCDTAPGCGGCGQTACEVVCTP